MYLARMFADTVHEADTVHPTTVGCTYEKCMEDTAGFADVLSFHDYSPTVAQIDENISKASAFAARVGKPFFNTEMGAGVYPRAASLLDGIGEQGILSFLE